MLKQKLILKQLDRIFQEWISIRSKQNNPTVGWVRTVRKALGMTTNQLAKRLGLARARVKQIESAEPKGAITLHALRAAANAMDCELIYAIVPKTSLENILVTRAKLVANKVMENVAHSMSLEAQSVSKEQQKEQVEDLVNDLLNDSPKKLWEE